MVLSFFVILPLGPLRAGSQKLGDYEAIDGDEQEEEIETHHDRQQDGLLSSSVLSTSGRSISSAENKGVKGALDSFKANLNRARGLFFP
jgi:battenin